MDTLCIQRGQWVPLRFTFWADSGKTNAIDLTGAEVTVSEASLDALMLLTPSVSEPTIGVVDLTIWEEQSRLLEIGRVNWFKLEAQFDHTNILTPKIWIKAND
ncbi:MAG: hypothetical protein ABJH63_04185 [Rhizobiaceae bacterium]